MPKEVIHQDGIEIGGSNSTPFAAQVSWGRDTHVQLATINLQVEDHTPEFGWYVDLDRTMVNRLIRALRRARDQAYGADE